MTRVSLIIAVIFLIVGACSYVSPKILGYSAYGVVTASKKLMPGHVIQKDDLNGQWLLIPDEDCYSEDNEVIGKTVKVEIPERTFILKTSVN